MKRSVLLISAVMLSMNLPAQEADSCKGRAMIGISWQSDWFAGFEAGYHRMLKPWFGIGGSLRLGTELAVSHLPYGFFTTGEYASWEAQNRVSKAGLKFSALFSPDLFRIGTCKIGVDIEPGILLDIPYERMNVSIDKYGDRHRDLRTITAEGGQWLACQLNFGLRLTHGTFSLGAGYGLSNYDAYSTARKLEMDGISFNKFYPDKTPLVQRFIFYASVAF